MRAWGLPFHDATASPVLGRLGVLNPGLAYALSLLGLVTITASLSAECGCSYSGLGGGSVGNEPKAR